MVGNWLLFPIEPRPTGRQISSEPKPRGALRFPWAILVPSLREEENEMAFGAEPLN
jgi:hypothetical protein